MIQATIYNHDLAEVCTVWLREAPHTGDKLWIADGLIKALDGWRVVEVEHQADRAWRPELVDASEPPHKLIVHVEVEK